MKAKIKVNHPSKLQQAHQIMQLSDLTELSDQELEMLVGGQKNWSPLPPPPDPGNVSGGGF